MSGTDRLGGNALLRYIAQVRDRRLEEIRAQSARERGTVLATARARSRAEVRRALREARADADARVALARAGAQARLRQARHARMSAAVAAVWPHIEAAVRRRWDEPEARRAWIAMALGEAARHLPGGAWHIEVPVALAPDDAADALRALVERRPDAVPQLAADPGLEAGLRVHCGEARLDASVAGLLRDRARVQGQWLATLARSGTAP